MLNAVSIAKYAKDVKKNNRAFTKMTDREKRVAVAKDALGQLLLGLYKSSPGTYIEVSRVPKSVTEATKVSELPKCNVCAIGSCLLSSFRLQGRNVGDALDFQAGFDDWTGREYRFAEGGDNSDETIAESNSGFDGDTLRDMESCFEGYETNKISAIPDTSVRLFAILKNVIANDGDFIKPPTDYSDHSEYVDFVTKEFKQAKREARGVKTH